MGWFYGFQLHLLINQVAEIISLKITPGNTNNRTLIPELESITASSYRVAQKIAEKRVSSTIDEYKAKIDGFDESEQQAGIALEICDEQISDLKDDVENLQIKNFICCHMKVLSKLKAAQHCCLKLLLETTKN